MKNCLLSLLALGAAARAADPGPKVDQAARVNGAVALLVVGVDTEAAYDVLAGALDFQVRRDLYGGEALPPEQRHRRAVNGLLHGANAAFLDDLMPGPFNPASRAAVIRALASKDEHVRAGVLGGQSRGR